MNQAIFETGTYNVVCLECGQVWQPTAQSPLWWKAKKSADSGRLDAIHVSGEDCGCIQPKADPDAPFRVFGYDGMCIDFDYPCQTSVETIKIYRECLKVGDIVFATGLSDAVIDRLQYGPR